MINPTVKGQGIFRLGAGGWGGGMVGIGCRKLGIIPQGKSKELREGVN